MTNITQQVNNNFNNQTLNVQNTFNQQQFTTSLNCKQDNSFNVDDKVDKQIKVEGCIEQQQPSINIKNNVKGSIVSVDNNIKVDDFIQ